MTTPLPPRLLDAAARETRIRTVIMVGALLAVGALVDPDRPLPIDICVFKNLTGLPCLTCGFTRSVCHALHGHVMTSLSFHPAGIIALVLMLGLGLVSAIEVLRGRRIFEHAVGSIVRGATWTAATITAVVWVARLTSLV